MIRWFLLGLLLLGFGSGLQRGWVVINWGRMAQDLNMPVLNDVPVVIQSGLHPFRKPSL